MMFSRNTVKPETINVQITEEQAIEIAKKLYNKKLTQVIFLLNLLHLDLIFTGKKEDHIKKQIL